jgi:hypothetical protein
MSLMYSVNTEITGSNRIQQSYTLNVMVSGVGIILGPTLSGKELKSLNISWKVTFIHSSVKICFSIGFILDNSANPHYSSVFKMAFFFYFLSIVAYSALKYLLVKYTKKMENNKVDSSYEELK